MQAAAGGQGGRCRGRKNIGLGGACERSDSQDRKTLTKEIQNVQFKVLPKYGIEGSQKGRLYTPLSESRSGLGGLFEDLGMISGLFWPLWLVQTESL